MTEAGMNLVGIVAMAFGLGLWLGATRRLRMGGAAERLLDGFLILSWLATVGFYLLAGLGIFKLWIAATLIAASGTAVFFLARKEAEPESTPTGLGWPSPRDPWLWAGLPVLVVALVRLVKGMIAPPMATDAMTVHLPKAAFWVQSASLRLPEFPDAWSYYKWFPAVGEILFAWVMLPVRGDLFLGPFGTLVWFLILIAAARLAAVFGAEPSVAWLAGLALAALPSVLVFSTANYVDNLLLLSVLLATLHGYSYFKTAVSKHALLGLAAAGIAIGIKTSAVVTTAPVLGAILWRAWSERRSVNPGLWSAMSAVLALPAAAYFNTWVRTGSPFYPFKAPLLPLPYSQDLADLFSGRYLIPEGARAYFGEVFYRLFWSPPFGQGHMNFGLGGALLGFAAVAGLVWTVARKRQLPTALWFTLVPALLVTPLVFSESNFGLWTIWIGVLARHLLPAWAPLLLWAAVLPRRWARLALSGSLLIGGVHLLPLGWSPSMTRPALQLAAVLAVSVGAIWTLQRFASTFLGTRVRWGLVAIVALLGTGAWTTIRAQARYPIYADTARDGAFDAHPTHQAFGTGAKLWPLLDTKRDLTLAVTVGKDRTGHNQFFYPLLGSRLQNQLIYIPVSAESDDEDHGRAERYQRGDPEVWLERVAEAAPDLVVGLWQPTPEKDWLGRRAEDYEVIAFTSLGAPWVGRRRDSPPLIPAAELEPTP